MLATVRFASSVSSAEQVEDEAGARDVLLEERERALAPGPRREVVDGRRRRRSFARVSGATSIRRVGGGGDGTPQAASAAKVDGRLQRPLPTASSLRHRAARSSTTSSPDAVVDLDLARSTISRMTSTRCRRSYCAIRDTRRISTASSRHGAADIIRTSATSSSGSAIARRLCSRSRISGVSKSDSPPTTLYGMPSSRSRSTIASRCRCLR